MCISFGYESGSQRVLDLIDKGLRVSDVPGILKELSHVSIGAQMMGFIGFPTETPEEALDTFEFLDIHKNHWALSAIGDFVLTPGAIVAKTYQDFGIEKISGYHGDDIIRSLYWIQGGQMRVPGDMRSSLIQKISKSLRRIENDRPFVGGIDSNHSILYFAKYGCCLVPSSMLNGKVSQSIIEMVLYESPLRKVDEFVDVCDLVDYWKQERSHGRSLSFDQVLNWLEEYPNYQNIEHDKSVIADDSEIIEIYPSGDLISVTKQTEQYMGNTAYITLKNLLLRGSGII